MGNYSRTPDTELAAALNQGYVRVRFQQAKPVLDRELNLAADLASSQLLAANYVGNGIGAGANGFAISNFNPAASEFAIAAGSALVNGIPVALTADTTYQTQPVKANVAPIPAGVTNVYLHVSTREVTSADDPNLANPADVTFETALREKAVWEVKVSAAAINQPDHLLLATLNTAGPAVTDLRRQNLNVAALRDDVTATGNRLNASLDAAGALKPAAAGLSQLRIQTVSINGALPPGGSTVLDLFTGNETLPLLVNVFPTTAGALSWSQSARRLLINGVLTVVRSVQIHNDSGAGISFRCEALTFLP